MEMDNKSLLFFSFKKNSRRLDTFKQRLEDNWMKMNFERMIAQEQGGLNK